MAGTGESIGHFGLGFIMGEDLDGSIISKYDKELVGAGDHKNPILEALKQLLDHTQR